MNKKYRRIEVKCVRFEWICPYKSCGTLQIVESAKKNDIVVCHNCRKESKIKKVI